MTAGMNSKGRIWKFTYSDDDQGGALPSGTVIYDNVYARLSYLRPTQALLEQGLETPSIIHALLTPGTMQIQSNYVYEDAYYPASPFYGKKFVVIGNPLVSMVDNRKYIAVTMRRFDTAHQENLQ